jgi:hypothetical protein
LAIRFSPLQGFVLPQTYSDIALAIFISRQIFRVIAGHPHSTQSAWKNLKREAEIVA